MPDVNWAVTLSVNCYQEAYKSIVIIKPLRTHLG